MPRETDQPTPPGVRVGLLAPEEWGRLRDIRLAALADSPEMFGSTLERELELEEAE